MPIVHLEEQEETTLLLEIPVMAQPAQRLSRRTDRSHQLPPLRLRRMDPTLLRRQHPPMDRTMAPTLRLEVRLSHHWLPHRHHHHPAITATNSSTNRTLMRHRARIIHPEITVLLQITLPVAMVRNRVVIRVMGHNLAATTQDMGRNRVVATLAIGRLQIIRIRSSPTRTRNNSPAVMGSTRSRRDCLLPSRSSRSMATPRHLVASHPNGRRERRMFHRPALSLKCTRDHRRQRRRHQL